MANPKQHRGSGCGIRVNTLGSNTTTGSEDASPGDSEDAVTDLNVLVSLTPTGPDVLGGLFHGPDVRERWIQATNAPCQRASQMPTLALGS